MKTFICLSSCWILTVLVSFTVAECPGSSFDCQTSIGECISSAFKCDGDEDCDNGRDEWDSVCKPQTPIAVAPVSCKAKEYQCKGTISCIPRLHLCNGQTDCPQEDDEQGCAALICLEDEFKCKKTGQCISKKWHCDGVKDCNDGEDEDAAECAAYFCQPGFRKCANDTAQSKGIVDCVRNTFWCDGTAECLNGADEAHCPNGTTCHHNFLRCADKHTCYHQTYHCDGENNCPDGSDEVGCPVTAPKPQPGEPICSIQETLCHDKSKCFQNVHKCDGEYDCSDQSDELGCQCPDHKFKCKFVHQCIEHSLVCNDLNECFDRSDEQNCPGKKVQCEEGHFLCNRSGNCISMDKVCDGHDDCSMHEDEEDCKADPCKGSTCDHCRAEHHRAVCWCPKGYELDGGKCKDIDECKISGSCSQICKNTEGSFTCECSEQHGYALLNGTFCRATGLSPQLIYANRDFVRSMDLAPLYREQNQLVQGTDIVWVTYDYAKGLIYYTDAIKEAIKCVTLHGEAHTFYSKAHSPDGLALDWVHQNLYVSDSRDNMIRVININHPNTVIDLYSGKERGFGETRALVAYPKKAWIFFSDWHSHTIYRAAMDGSSLKPIYKHELSWANGLAIDLVTERLYWTDAGLHGIYSSDLHGNHQQEVVSPNGHMVHPFGMALFEDTMYWSDWNKTKIFKANKYRNGADIEAVLPLAQPMDVNVYHSVLQPTYTDLCAKSNCEHICLPSPPRSNSDTPSYSCHCRHGYDLQENKRSCVMAPALTHPQSATSSGPGSGVIAGVVIAAALIVLAIAIGVGVGLYRYYRSKEVRRCHFDNPVYQKTTTPTANGREIPEDRLRLRNYEEPPPIASNNDLEANPMV